MERSMKRLTTIGESNDAKSVLKKVNVDDYRKALNDVLYKAWDDEVTRACLNMGSREAGFVYELYWINKPMAHTFSTTEKKIAKLLKDFPDSPYSMLTDDATALLEKLKPYAEKAAGYKERLANQVVESKEPKDPIAMLPPASRAAMLKIRGMLDNRCSELKSKLEASYKAGLHNVLSEFLELPESERLKPLYKLYQFKTDRISLLRRMIEWKMDDNNNHVAVEHPDAQAFIQKTAQQSADNTVDSYVYKHTIKLAGVIEHMPNIAEIKLNAHSMGGRIEGDLNLSFDDGRSFRVHSQIVLAESPKGLIFARYPTTFHDVTKRDGSLEGKMLSEAEMRDWSQDKTAEAGMGY